MKVAELVRLKRETVVYEYLELDVWSPTVLFYSDRDNIPLNGKNTSRSSSIA
jgi:hypothetical protein